MSPADAFAAAFEVAGLRHFTRIEHHVAIASTNDAAQEQLGEAGAAGLVIVADEQTAGKGRRGRRWVAPPRSGLLFTAILPEPLSAQDAWSVSFWAGLCVARALERWIAAPLLQWPNDVLVDGRKLCGILCVSRIVGDRAAAACGVGTNVYRPENRPDLDVIVPPPIYLDDLALVGQDARAELLVAMLRAFEAALPLLHDPQAVAREWERRAGLPGTRYRLTFGDRNELEGEALGLSPTGALIVRAGGAERTIDLADEVRVVR